MSIMLEVLPQYLPEIYSQPAGEIAVPAVFLEEPTPPPEPYNREWGPVQPGAEATIQINGQSELVKVPEPEYLITTYLLPSPSLPQEVKDLLRDNIINRQPLTGRCFTEAGVIPKFYFMGYPGRWGDLGISGEEILFGDAVIDWLGLAVSIDPSNLLNYPSPEAWQKAMAVHLAHEAVHFKNLVVKLNSASSCKEAIDEWAKDWQTEFEVEWYAMLVARDLNINFRDIWDKLPQAAATLEQDDRGWQEPLWEIMVLFNKGSPEELKIIQDLVKNDYDTYQPAFQEAVNRGWLSEEQINSLNQHLQAVGGIKVQVIIPTEEGWRVIATPQPTPGAGSGGLCPAAFLPLGALGGMGLYNLSRGAWRTLNREKRFQEFSHK